MDARYTGFPEFRYYVTPFRLYSDYTTVLPSERFQTWRIWCWETWGPSCEVETAVDILARSAKTDIPWAWDTGKQYVRLYLRDDTALMWFQTKFA